MGSLIEAIRQLVAGNKVAIAVIIGAVALVPIWIFVWPELRPVLGELWQMMLSRYHAA